LNTGLQAVHNLAWKLARVIQGSSSDQLLDTYELERLNAALWTMENTNRNADEIFDIVNSASANDWYHVRRSIAQSRRGGTNLGQDLGISYQRSAFLPDGSLPIQVNDPVNDYQPSARPGARAPHLWIKRNEKTGSILDLFGYRIVLLAGKDLSDLPAPGPDLAIFRRDVDFEAKDFERTYGIGLRGAVLLRPEGYVMAPWVGCPSGFADRCPAVISEILHAATP
jgi:hypothetical protein